MFRVKITTGHNRTVANIARQLPDNKLVSLDGRYKFLLDDETREADFWVVRNKYIRQPTTCKVAPENTILMISEPQTVIRFPKKYCAQFGIVHSCQHIEHEHFISAPAALPWFIDIDGNFAVSYGSLNTELLPQKTKLISLIVSDKAFTHGHRERIKFAIKLKEYFGDKIDIFGRGIREIDDKWMAIAPYKYHVAIENSSAQDYWTEKLSDCFLAGTYPLYFGCQNVTDYFPSQSLTQIDIHNAETAIVQIEQIMNSQTYEHNLDALIQAKRLCLDKYNIFSMITQICDTLNPNAKKKNVTLHPAQTMLNFRNFINFNFTRHYHQLCALRDIKHLKSLV